MFRRSTAFLVRCLTVVAAVLGPRGDHLAAQATQGSWRQTIPSPTSSSLGRFGEIPVSLYSGIPDVSIPLVTAKGRTLSLPITLRYHGGGIRVADIGGWAGIGWTLDAGGVITRSVRGQTDDVGGGYFNTGNMFWQPGNWPSPPTTLLQLIANGAVDGEPDVYMFNFAGRSGQLIGGPTSTNAAAKEYRTVPYQKLQIQAIGTAITAWTIITEDGTKYTFDALESTADFSGTTPGGIIPGPNGLVHTSSWYLTKIEAPGGDQITLAYTNYSARHRLGVSVEQHDAVTGACGPNLITTTIDHQLTIPRLTTITSAAHTITFGTTLRTDARSPVDNSQQEPRIDLMTVATPGGTVIRKFAFTHDYSTGRLTLRGVAEQDAAGTTSLPPYRFDYDLRLLPAIDAWSADHWGFYNGKSNSVGYPTAIAPNGQVFPGADLTPDPIFATAGMVTKITYPTGGSSQFIYEGNAYGSIHGTAPVVPGPVQTSSVTSNANQGLVTSTMIIGGTQAVITTITSIFSDGCVGVPCPFVEIIGQGSWQVTGTTYLLLPAGTYTIRASHVVGTGFAQMSVNWQEPTVNYNVPGGGVRIKEIQTVDALGATTYQRFQYVQQAAPTRSSGAIVNTPVYSISYTDPVCSYFSRSSSPHMTLGDGPAVGYSEVAVLRGTVGVADAFGKTVSLFTSPATIGDGVAPTWPFSGRTSYEWRRGRITRETILNGSGQTQRRTGYADTYRDDGPTPEPTTTRRFRGMSVKAFGGCVGCTTYLKNEFEVISGWAYQNSDTTAQFDETGASSFPTVRTYTYANPAHIQLTELTETNSNGTQRITRMKYPADYPATGGVSPEAVALNNMQGAAVHMHSPVIERWVVEKIGTVERVMRSELTTFKAFGAWYLPFQRFILNNPVPVQ